ncbi:MAG TPA: cytochrome c-type biogenesis protein [Xanthobacteraceae bacterium]
MRIATPLRLLLLAATLAAAGPSFAVRPDEILPDPQLEARARALSHELRCMVCQNQSIDDSDAPLAHDLRVLVRDRLKAGDTDQGVLDYLVARYGEFVLLKPRFEWQTMPLWLAPVAIFSIGGLSLVVAVRRRRRARGTSIDTPAPLSKSEQARLAELTGAERS